MSLYPPPRENLPIFDSSNFEINNSSLTVDSGLEYFLAFPTAQGEETLANTIVAGSLTALGTANFTSTTLGSLTSSAIQPPSNDASTKIPTTAWVQTAVSGGGGSAPNLSQVLLVNNSAGGTSINMNNNNVSNCQSVQAKTFNMLNNSNALTGSYITNTVAGQVDFESVGISPTNINTSYRFSLRGTNPSTPIYPLQLTSTANNMNVPLNMNTNAISNVTTMNLSGVLTTTNAIDMTGGPTAATNNISTRQLSLKDVNSGNSNGTAIFTGSNTLILDSRGPIATTSTIQFSVKNTANSSITSLLLSPTEMLSSLPLRLNGGVGAGFVQARSYSFYDALTNADALNGNILYSNAAGMILEAKTPSSKFEFTTQTSGGTDVLSLSVQSSQMVAQVPLDMINTGSYFNATVRARYFNLRDLVTSALTNCGMYFSSNILQIDSTSGSAATATSMFLRTTKTDGSLTNALQLTNTTVKTDCYAITALPANDNSNSIPTTTWVQNLLSTFTPSNSIKEASSAGSFTTTAAGNQILGVLNIPLSGGSFLVPDPTNGWEQNQGVTFRINYFQSFNPRASSPQDSQNYISFSSMLTLYPWRFQSVGWLSAVVSNGPRGRVSDNVIVTADGNSNTNYITLDTTTCSAGRQFWSNNISFQANGSFLGRLYVYGGASIDDVVFELGKPDGYSYPNQIYSYTFSIELVNKSNTFSNITSSGFNISNF